MRSPGSGSWAHQRGTAVEQRQHLVRLGGRPVQDDASDTAVAIPLDQIRVFGHAEDRYRNGPWVPPGFRCEFAKFREEPEHLAVGGSSRVRQPAVAVFDGSPRAVWI